MTCVFAFYTDFYHCILNDFKNMYDRAVCNLLLFLPFLHFDTISMLRYNYVKNP